MAVIIIMEEYTSVFPINFGAVVSYGGIIILLTISEYVIKTSVYSKKIGNIPE